MRIRKMNINDIEQVVTIENESFSMPWSRGSFVTSLGDTNQIFLVAEEEGLIIGYAGIWNIVGEGNITNIAVKKEYQKQGIGNKILRELLLRSEAMNVYDFTLEVRKSNVGAIRLYESLEFKPVGYRKNYYEKPLEDGLIMWYHKN